MSSSKLLGPPCGYTDVLDAHIEAKLKAEVDAPRRYFPLRPSASGYCSRKLAFDLMEYRGHANYQKELKSPAIHRLLNLGHNIEYHLLRHYEELSAFQVKYKQQVVEFFQLDNGEYVDGSIDFVLWSEQYKAVGDVKSKGDKFSSWTANKWDEDTAKLKKMKSVVTLSETAFWVEDLPAFLDELNDPFFADNFYQLNGYANTKFLQDRGVDHAFIVQYNKNDSRIREVRFKPSREVFERVERKFKTVQQAVDNHQDPTLVPRDYRLGSVRCAFCDYAKQCWPDADSRKAFFKELPAKRWPKDTDRMDSVIGTAVEMLYERWLQATDGIPNAQAIEAELCGVLDDAGIDKVRFADGAVYEVKFLKSPRPHFELRRSKA